MWTGVARWYLEYASEQTLTARVRYKQAAIEANTGMIGEWIDPASQPPFPWRRMHRKLHSNIKVIGEFRWSRQQRTLT